MTKTEKIIHYYLNSNFDYHEIARRADSRYTEVTRVINQYIKNRGNDE